MRSKFGEAVARFDAFLARIMPSQIPQSKHDACSRLDTLLSRFDTTFNEADHPRAADGKFGSGGSAAHAGPVGEGAKEHVGVRGGIDKGEAASIKHYTAEGFKAINWGLRGIRPHTPAGLAHATEIDRVMSRADLPEAMTVHRGVGGNGLKAILAQGLKKGQIINDPGFLSASKDPGTARKFAQTSNENIHLEIRLPKGAKAVDIAKLSDAPGEHEVLIARNSGLKVVSYDKKSRKVVMEWVSHAKS
jgi:ADP-ribosyltransferase exoenzyme